MKVIADLQLHSRFSRAVSQEMNIPTISEWAMKKGIELVATGDWTHPLWFRELESQLREAGEGVYRVEGQPEGSPRFLLSTEISSIYSQKGKLRKIHTLLFAPSFSTVSKINKELTLRGANLLSDGRPIVGLTAKNVAEIALEIDSRCLIIPAHAWTPHFSLYGSVSGFDSIEECFGEVSPQIYAIETGLSSDPAMNWRIEELKNRRIVSFSDAHSPAKLGREATVFQIKKTRIENQGGRPKINNINYNDIYDAIRGNPEGDWEIGCTIEFYPEEGKYHYTGHRNCQIVYSPNETRKMGTTCPICGRQLTVGVMSRVEELASTEIETESQKDEFGVRWIKDREGKRAPYVMMVPLLEILAEVLGTGNASQKVRNLYELLTSSLGSEFKVLLETKSVDIERVGGPKVAEAINKVRSGDIVIEPGYDGVFGKVKIWKSPTAYESKDAIDQGTLF